MSYAGRAVIADAILNPLCTVLVAVGDYLPRDFTPTFPLTVLGSDSAELPLGILPSIVRLAAEQLDVKTVIGISVLIVHASGRDHVLGD